MSLPKSKSKLWSKKGLIAIVVALLLIGAGSAWYFLGLPGSPIRKAEAQSGSTIQTAVVRRGDLSISISGSGTYIANQSVDLSFSTSGSLTELNVKVGDVVKAGDKLASLGSTESLEADVAAAQLSYLEAQQALTELQDNADVSLAKAYQTWVNAKADYETALLKSQRTAGSRCSDAVNKKYSAAIDTAKEKLAAAVYGSDSWINYKNVYDQAVANYSYCSAYTATEKVEANADLDLAKETMAQAERTYNTLKTGSGIDPDELALAEVKVKQTETAFEDAKQTLAGVTLTAPIAGKITYLAADKGAIVDTAKFVTIAVLTPPMMTVQVDESDLDKFTVDSQASVVFDALPDLTLSGKVVEVDPELYSSGNIKVAQGRVELDGTAAQSLANMPLGLNASVEIIQKQTKNALLVPIEALRDLGDNQYAVFVVKDGSLRLQTVEVGLKDSTWAEITSGLNQGDVVSTGTATTFES